MTLLTLIGTFMLLTCVSTIVCIFILAGRTPSFMAANAESEQNDLMACPVGTGSMSGSAKRDVKSDSDPITPPALDGAESSLVADSPEHHPVDGGSVQLISQPRRPSTVHP